MTAIVKFSRSTEALGRNGYMKVKGISLLVSEARDLLVLEPVNSRGMIGRCSLKIPLEDLEQVIDSMRQVQRAPEGTKPAPIRPESAP